LDPDLEALSFMSAHLDAALGTVADGQLSWSTPCSDWDLAALIDHVTGGNWFTAKILEGRAAEAALAEVRAQFGEGSASLKAASTSVRDQAMAFERPGVLEGTWHHVAGDLTGRQILRLRLHDLIIHTWDVQQTIDPPASLPRALARWGLTELSDPDSLAAEHFRVAPSFSDTGAANRVTTYLSTFDRQP